MKICQEELVRNINFAELREKRFAGHLSARFISALIPRGNTDQRNA